MIENSPHNGGECHISMPEQPIVGHEFDIDCSKLEIDCSKLEIDIYIFWKVALALVPDHPCTYPCTFSY